MSDFKKWWCVADYLDQGKNGQQFILVQMGYVVNGRLVNSPKGQHRVDCREPALVWDLFNETQYGDFDESVLMQGL